MLDQAAPDFALPATGGQTLSLAALRGRKVAEFSAIFVFYIFI